MDDDDDDFLEWLADRQDANGYRYGGGGTPSTGDLLGSFLGDFFRIGIIVLVLGYLIVAVVSTWWSSTNTTTKASSLQSVTISNTTVSGSVEKSKHLVAYIAAVDTQLLSKQDSKSQAILSVPKGSIVYSAANTINTTWCTVVFKELQGFLPGAHLTEASSNTAFVTTNRVNFRKQPTDTMPNIIENVAAGTQVRVLEYLSDGWCRVQYGSQNGYMWSEYLRKAN